MAREQGSEAPRGPLNPVSPEDMAEHAVAASDLLRALANPNRLMILCVLSEGESSVSQLNARVPLSQSALSQHLSVLRRDGLVMTRREQQSIYYSLADGPAVQIIETLHALYCGAPVRSKRSKR